MFLLISLSLVKLLLKFFMTLSLFSLYCKLVLFFILLVDSFFIYSAVLIDFSVNLKVVNLSSISKIGFGLLSIISLFKFFILIKFK